MSKKKFRPEKFIPPFIKRWIANYKKIRKQRMLIQARKLIWKACYPQQPGTVLINGEGKKIMVENVTLDLRKNMLDYKYSRLKGTGPNRKQRSAMRSSYEGYGD